MKKLTAILVVLCMVLGICPAISFAENTTVDAVRTAYFNSASEWAAAQSGEGEGVSVLVAYNGSDNWQAANTFTDTDGEVTRQTVTSGTAFNTSRNALVAFKIPEDFDAEKTGMVTLALTLKYFKQVAKGVRLAVYGNSVSGTWSVSGSNKTTFGANGTDSGLASLPLLGLTSPIETGVAGEKLTLSSYALTDYVKQMAQEGKMEVTFRLAIPYGGAWIYTAESDYPPTLKIEEGVVTTLNVKTVFYNGEEEVLSESETVDKVVSGSVYEYGKTPTATVVRGEDIFVYSKEKSKLSVTVEEDGSSEIIIAYEKNTDANSFSGYEFEDEGAWCWFADPRAVVLKNEEGTIDVTVIGYIDVHGNIKATQINNRTNKVDEVLIRTNIQPDDHNNPTFIMIPDGRIVTFYSRHTDEACFWYRVTEEPGDLTTLGEEKCLVTANNTTYPSPFWLSDDPEHIYLCWRGIEWHPTIAKLSLPDENGDMEFTFGPYQMVRSSGVGSNVRPYAKYATNGKDRIYISYTGTHPDNYNPNWLYCNYIDISDMTMHDINGNLMRTIANGPLIVDHSNQSHIVDKTSNVRNWLWQVAIADDGYPVIANVRIDSSKNNHKYYYVKWNGTEWVKTFLTDAGGKFHPSNTEYCYSGGMSIDVDNPNVIYCSKPVEGVFGKVFEVFKYTMSADGKSVVSTEQITQNSIKNNVRPWVIPGSEGDDLRVMWMNGDYDFWMVNSQYPAGYPTRIMGEVELPKELVDLEYAFVVEDYEKIGGVFVSTEKTVNTVFEEYLYDEFTVSANVYLDGSYQGNILDMGNVKLFVKNLPTRYADNDTADRARVVVIVGDEEYVTSNVYGTSDEWKNHDIRTGGEYFFTKYDKYVNHTLTYDGEYLTLYRDGLIDFKEKVELDPIARVEVGGFDGYVEDVYVYDRALNRDEIKELCIEYEVVDPEIEPNDEVTVDYLLYGGKDIGLEYLEKIKPSEKALIYPGTDLYIPNPDESFVYEGAVYVLEKYGYIQAKKQAYAVYRKGMIDGENLVPDGDFTDDEGNFSWGTWQTPRADGGYNNGYYKDRCSDWFYKVNRDTNAAGLYESGNVTAEDYALGTRWNDGSTGTCSMANFIPVEAGKTYYVSYDYKHKTARADATYISTAFVSEKDFALNASGNNIPQNVTTSWQTNEFVITAEEDGYIYFHFSYLGNSNNAGSGPYWYFDNFNVQEVKPVIVDASITFITADLTTVHLENLIDEDITGLNVYAAEYDGDAVVKAQKKTVDISVEDEAENVDFDLGGNVKVFIWDENMTPVCEAVNAVAFSDDTPVEETNVMVVTKVTITSLGNKEAIRIRGIKGGSEESIFVAPDLAESINVEKGSVILYSMQQGYATDITVLFDSTKDAPAEAVNTDIENILSENYSNESVTIHYGAIEGWSRDAVTINGCEYMVTDETNIIVLDYNGATVSIEVGHINDAKTSTKYNKTAFVKTVRDSETEVSDMVIFITEL